MSNVVDFHGFKLTGKKMSPEQYSVVVQRAMKNKDKWVNRPMYDTNLIVATAYKNKGSWRA